MMKAMRSLRAMSIHHENLDDPTPSYEPSPKYEPPAEKSNYVSTVASRRTSFTSHHQVSPVVQEHSMTWNKWTIPEGDQSKLFGDSSC